jgi:hypothetical protein
MIFPDPVSLRHGLSAMPASDVLPCVLTLAQAIESG